MKVERLILGWFTVPASVLLSGNLDLLRAISRQVVGRPADEPTLLALASQLEAARPWTQPQPGAPSASADADYC
jgi:Asp-tRNA(Asn)/Glu-tRNA(Gln) amidotransferase A subunit family amidase